MQLKQYQKRVLSDLDRFLLFLDEQKDISNAYATTWLENGIPVGGDGMPSYKDTIPQVPHICFKVPTGGGKTVMGCASLKHIFDALERMMSAPMQEKIVVWLVPSNAILDQTLKALKDPSHDYRRQIDADFHSRVEVLNGAQALNGQNFTPTTVRENLTIIVMSFDSLRIRRKEGRKVYQENGNLEGFVATYEHPENMIPDAEDNSLMQVLNQKSPVVIIDESHNAQSELSVEMLKNLNPSFVLDLTATPRVNSNIISIVDAYELKRENMVKLPIIVYNRSSQTDVVNDAIGLRANLERKAKQQVEAGGDYIRPIVLFQAQPRTNEDAATFEKLKALLIECGIPENQIAIKTSEINELKDVDLKSKECPIRFIITVNALKEGWDCPFAYILATVASRSSRVDVEQIVGRILRLPYAHQHSDVSLNMSYVLTSSNNFSVTVNDVIKGLNQAGFTDHDFRAIDNSAVSPSPPQPESVPPRQIPITPPEDGGNAIPDEADNGFEIDPVAIRQGLQQSQGDHPVDPADSDAVAEMMRQAAQQGGAYEQASRNTEGTGEPPTGGDEMRHRFEMQADYEQDAQSILLPRFVKDVGASLFSDHEKRPVTKEALTEGFTLADKDIQISFTMSEEDMMKIDIDNCSKPRMISLREREAIRFREFIRKEPPEQKRPIIAHNICMNLNRLDYVSERDLKDYVRRVVDNMTSEELEKAEDALPYYARCIWKKIEELADEYREKQFFRQIETGDITIEPSWKFAKQISPMPTMMPLEKALYTDEGDVNGFEFRVIKFIASLDVTIQSPQL